MSETNNLFDFLRRMHGYGQSCGEMLRTLTRRLRSYSAAQHDAASSPRVILSRQVVKSTEAIPKNLAGRIRTILNASS